MNENQRIPDWLISFAKWGRRGFVAFCAVGLAASIAFGVWIHLPLYWYPLAVGLWGFVAAVVWFALTVQERSLRRQQRPEMRGRETRRVPNRKARGIVIGVGIGLGPVALAGWLVLRWMVPIPAPVFHQFLIIFGSASVFSAANVVRLVRYKKSVSPNKR